MRRATLVCASRTDPQLVVPGPHPSFTAQPWCIQPSKATLPGQPHPAVFIWHHSSRASLADFFSLLSSVSTLMSWI